MTLLSISSWGDFAKAKALQAGRTGPFDDRVCPIAARPQVHAGVSSPEAIALRQSGEDEHETNAPR